jgi:tetratricopeptide (TPR) repeat protein
LEAIARDRNGARAYTALARLRENAGRGADAEAALRQGLSVNPGSTLIAVALADHYRTLKNFQDARQTLAGIHTPAALRMLGWVNLDDRNYGAAEAAFRECFRLQPNDIRGLQGIGEAYARQNRAAEAIRVLSVEAGRTPADADVRAFVGRFADHLGKPDEAAAEYEKALAIPAGRGRFELWLELSDVYRHKGDAAAALRSFDSACRTIAELLESMPVEPGMIYGFVRRYYERALAAEPDDAVLKQILEKIAALTPKK